MAAGDELGDDLRWFFNSREWQGGDQLALASKIALVRLRLRCILAHVDGKDTPEIRQAQATVRTALDRLGFFRRFRRRTPSDQLRQVFPRERTPELEPTGPAVAVFAYTDPGIDQRRCATETNAFVAYRCGASVEALRRAGSTPGGVAVKLAPNGGVAEFVAAVARAAAGRKLTRLEVWDHGNTHGQLVGRDDPGQILGPAYFRNSTPKEVAALRARAASGADVTLFGCNVGGTGGLSRDDGAIITEALANWVFTRGATITTFTGLVEFHGGRLKLPPANRRTYPPCQPPAALKSVIDLMKSMVGRYEVRN